MAPVIQDNRKKTGEEGEGNRRRKKERKKERKN